MLYDKASAVVPVIIPTQASVVEAVVAVAEHCPVTLAKVGVTGAVVSFTVTVKEQVAFGEHPLFAVIVTVVTPLLKVDPVPVPAVPAVTVVAPAN